MCRADDVVVATNLKRKYKICFCLLIRLKLSTPKANQGLNWTYQGLHKNKEGNKKFLKTN